MITAGAVWMTVMIIIIGTVLTVMATTTVTTTIRTIVRILFMQTMLYLSIQKILLFAPLILILTTIQFLLIPLQKDQEI